jgi:hypothetical protein
MSDCIFSNADTHQRGHTCWFDTAVITLANSLLLNANTIGEGRSIFKSLSLKSSIQTDISKQAGLAEYSSKLHAKISKALSNEVCPMKPTEGQDMLSFLKALIDHVNIDSIVMKAPSFGNRKSIQGNPEYTCGTIDVSSIDDFIEENLGKAMKSKNFESKNGILLVQFRGSAGECIKLQCDPEMKIETPAGIFKLTLRTMTISNRGHVMAMGRCRDQTEWTVFDNEFSGLGYSPRTYSAETFEQVREEMFSFPHCFFSPKVGVIQMNPFFKEGIKSATVFVYDMVRE